MAKETDIVVISDEELKKCRDLLVKISLLATKLNCTIDVAASILMLVNKK